MATSAVNLTFSSTISSAEIQAVWQWLAGILAAGGFVKTTESGEVNTSTVTWPGSDGSSGFQIWRMDDALQATVPCFFKLEVTRSGSASSVTLAITIGTGSDGSGNITGVVLARTEFVTSSSYVINYTTATSQPFYASANDGESFRFCSRRTEGGAYSAAFAIERTKDANGDGTSDGVLLFAKLGKFNSSYTYFKVVKWVGASPAAEGYTAHPGGGSCLPPRDQITGLASDNDVAVYPFYHFDIGKTLSPMLGFCGVFAGDVGVGGSTQTVNLFGTNHTMMVIEASHLNLSRGTPGTAGNTNLATFMRYE